MKISEIREAFDECSNDFPEDVRKSLASKLGVAPYHVGYAFDQFGDGGCYYITKLDSGVFFIDPNNEKTVVRKLK